MTEEEKQQIIEAANSSKTVREAAKKVGLPYRTYAYRAQKLGVYRPNKSPVGINRNGGKAKVPLEEILEGLHPMYNAYDLKRRLLKTGTLENKCCSCGHEGDWNGTPLNLQLDHIDGDSYNHRFGNLRLLCPNCHSQTDTFSGKNHKRRISDEQLVEAFRRIGTITGTLRDVGLSKSMTNIQRLKDLLDL